MNDLAKNALSNVYLVVRMVSGGILALLIFLADRSEEAKLYGVPLLREVLLTGSDNWWKIAVAGAFLGIVAHAFFSTVFENLLMIVPIRWLRWRSKDDIPKEFLSGSYDKFIRTLFRERAARRSTKDDNVRAMQDALDRDYNFHIFLYCTAILLLFFQCLVWLLQLGTHMFEMVCLIFLWLMAFWSDINLTRHEAWLVKYHPQWEPSEPRGQPPLT